MDAYRSYLEGQGLAQTTIKNHIRNLTKYGESFGLNANQDTTLANLLTYAEGSQRQTMTSTISKYRSFMNYENDKIKASVGVSLAKTLELNQATNKAKTLPALSFFKKRMNQFFKDEKYKEYVVLYLLINLNVRNMDLVISNQPTDSNNTLSQKPDTCYMFATLTRPPKNMGRSQTRLWIKSFVLPLDN